MNISRRDLVFRSLTTISCGAFYKASDTTMGAETVNEKENETFFKLYPVGIVERQGKSVNLRIDGKRLINAYRV
ncbi:hypothetical protein ACFL3Q_08630 [Planctomycetota bacterium]